MESSSALIDYRQTGYFSKMVTDYLAADEKLQPFYKHPVSVEGIKAAIGERRQFDTDRKLLVEQLLVQYAGMEVADAVKTNINSLLNENTFTVCTAHQPNIFTGHLYFIYKILHAVKLSAALHQQIPGCNFIPVYYMGSEDADLDELGHIYLNGDKLQWNTQQTGAVGRMIVDKDLVRIIETISGQLTIHPFGDEIVSLMSSCYKEGVTVEMATFRLVNELFAPFGLVILLPDNALLKKAFIPVIEKELTEEFSHPVVQETVSRFPSEYKVQPTGRQLNMFYLTGDKRERIEKSGEQWLVLNSDLQFSKKELISELQQHPERFSPNVILRPVFQEFILPNVLFIGGGGEIAYWLQLKNVFGAVKVPYPVLVLRNSFMLIDKNQQHIIKKWNLGFTTLFKSELDIMNELVKRDCTIQLNLDNEKEELNKIYDRLKTIAGLADSTLQHHTEALQTKALKRIAVLEKKMMGAERKKRKAEENQLHKLKTQLFPNNNLQERVENVMPLYAKWGKSFFETLYSNSLNLEQQFTILSEIDRH